MKENKCGMRISATLTITSLICTIILLFLNNNCKFLIWLNNLAFAVLGSALVSFFVCRINYKVYRKKLIMELVNDIYKYDNEAETQLYNARFNKKLENLAATIGVICSHLNNIIYEAYNIKIGLSLLDKKSIAILDKIIYKLERETQVEIKTIGDLLQDEPKLATQSKDYLYQRIEQLLRDQTVYNLSKELAKRVKTGMKDTEETYHMSEEVFKNKQLNKLKEEIKIFKTKSNNKNKAIG